MGGGGGGGGAHGDPLIPFFCRGERRTHICTHGARTERVCLLKD